MLNNINLINVVYICTFQSHLKKTHVVPTKITSRYIEESFPFRWNHNFVFHISSLGADTVSYVQCYSREIYPSRNSSPKRLIWNRNTADPKSFQCFLADCWVIDVSKHMGLYMRCTWRHCSHSVSTQAKMNTLTEILSYCSDWLYSPSHIQAVSHVEENPWNLETCEYFTIKNVELDQGGSKFVSQLCDQKACDGVEGSDRTWQLKK